MKGVNRYMKRLLVAFWGKKLIWGNLIFLAFSSFFTVWLGMVKLSQATINWILKESGHVFFYDYHWIFINQDMNRILKQWRHDSSGKHLRDQYCMDIMRCLCGGQNSWFCEASLIICYVSLFECKGPWMLKTVINCHVWNRRFQN